MFVSDESGSQSPKVDDEEMALHGLLTAFASSFTLDQIASAYCVAGKDADIAADLLLGMQTSDSASMVGAEPKGGDQSLNARKGSKSRHTNSRSHPASVGSVSSLIGKGYVRATQPKNRSNEVWKPVKLDARVLPESAIWGEEDKPSCGRNDPRSREMEEFMYSMLHDGFKLERGVIREVLDACGYDMPKSMEKLIGLAEESLGGNNKFPELGSKAETLTRQGKSKSDLVGNHNTSSNGKEEVSSEETHTVDLPREVLTSLFRSADRNNDDFLPKKRTITVKRSGIFGKPVSEPLEDFTAVCETSAVSQEPHDDYDIEQDEHFQAVRGAVKEYRAMTKEYYQTASEAFAKGDLDKAHKLFDEGTHLHKKAMEKDRESNEMILDTREEDAQNVVVLDLHDLDAKGAIRLLKCHLSLAVKRLKLIIETNEEDSSKGSRRRLIHKLLERESIKWEEEENGRTILIKLENINRKK